MRSLTTTAPGAANAASASPPATFQWKARLSGALVVDAARPLPLAAFCGSTTAGSGSYVDLDEVERVVGLIGGVGDDDGDAVADVAHGVAREERILGDLEVGVGQQPGARHRLERVGDVGAGVDGERRPAPVAAFDVSIGMIVACACGLRSIAAWTMPGSDRSSV